MRHFLALLAGLLVSAPLCALEVKDNTITLTDNEVQMCKDSGGCGVVTRDGLMQALKESHDVGLHECRNAT